MVGGDIDVLARVFERPGRSEGLYGVVIGLVTNNQDPDGLGRIKVQFPWLSDTDESHWARIATAMAGANRGFYWLPEVDDEVLVVFEHGQIEFPYILGCLWNGKDKPIEKNDDGKNNLRTITSRSGHVIRLDDTDGKEKIEISDKSKKNSIVISTADNSIVISADADITIKSKDGKLKLQGKGVEITSDAAVKIEASQAMDIKSSAGLKLKGSTVDIN